MKLLLDEHVGRAVAGGLERLHVDAVGLRHWRGGRFLEAPDEAILEEAAREGRALVTYDQRTIVPLLKVWAETGRHHGGVVFVDHRSIAPNDIGALVHALAELERRLGAVDWTDHTAFLQRPTPQS